MSKSRLQAIVYHPAHAINMRFPVTDGGLLSMKGLASTEVVLRTCAAGVDSGVSHSQTSAVPRSILSHARCAGPAMFLQYELSLLILRGMLNGHERKEVGEHRQVHWTWAGM
jgi:hypothetical protein